MSAPADYLSRNIYCRHCGENFADGACYCVHRVGPPLNRRCLDHRELLAFGMRYSDETWYYQCEDQAWLFHLARTDESFACAWPFSGWRPHADYTTDVVDTDALAERQEGPLKRV